MATDAGTSRPERAAWLKRLVPGAYVLRGYQRSWLRGDVLAGITVAAYLVPQVMAYAEVAGLPPVVGLWATLAPLLVYAFFGSSRQLSVGPESGTSLMTAAAVGGMVGLAGPDRYAEVAALLALAVGAICILGRIARLSFLADLLSRPVLVGYMAGIAFLMIVSQLDKVTGQRLAEPDPLPRVWEAVRQLDQVHAPTLVLSVVLIVGLFAIARFAPTWPGPLIAMLASAAVVSLAGLQRLGVTVIGQVPSGVPVPRVPDVTAVDLQLLVPAAIGIALVGYSDNVLVGRAFAAKKGERIDTDTELVGLGLANIAAGLTQGYPISSSGSRTVVGDAMGSRTQLYSLVVVVVVVLTMLVGGPLLAAFPTAALGAVVVYAAVRLIDIAEFRRLARFRLSELVLALIAMASVVAFNVLIGIGIAVGLSLLDLLRRISAPHDAILGFVPGEAGMHDIDDYEDTTTIAGLLVYRYDAPLFFANADNLVTRALAAVDHTPAPVRWFVLNCEANTLVDLTAVDALDYLRRALADRGIEFALARVTFEVHAQLERAGLIDKLGDDRVFATLPTAVEAYLQWHEDTFAARPESPVLGPGMVWRPHPDERER